MNPIKRFLVAWKSAGQDKPVFNSFQSIFGGLAKRTPRDYYYGIIYSCIDAIATGVSAIDYELYKTTAKGDKTEVDNHDAIKLLRTPNLYQTGVDLLYTLSSHIDTNGRAFLYPVRALNGKNVVELWALDPNKMIVVPGNGRFISGYVFINPKGEKVPFETNEIIPIYRPNPYNQLEGISTIDMSRRSIEADINAQTFNQKFFENGATPSGVLTTDQVMDDDSYQRLKDQFDDKYRGIQNAHKTLILDSGLTYSQTQISQRDMDFVKQRQMTRDEILSIFKVPKTIVAITDDVNRANAEVSDYVFAKRVLKPRLELIFERLNRFYLPMFANSEGLELEFENPVPEDKEAELKYDVASVNTWETVNEVRDRHGLEPIDGGDELPPPSYNNGGSPITLSHEGHDHQKKKMLMTKSAKDKQYIFEKRKSIAKLTKELDASLKQQFALLVKDIRAKDIKRLRVKGVVDTLADIMPDQTELAGIVAELLLNKHKQSFEAGVKLTANTYDLSSDFDWDLLGATAVLKSRAKVTADSVVNTIYERANKIVADLLEQDSITLRQVRDELASQFDDLAPYSAERIARTEMSFAFNEGAINDMEASGFVEKIKWILGDDACELCQKLADDNGGVYNLKELPAQPPVHPNCECDIIPYFGA